MDEEGIVEQRLHFVHSEIFRLLSHFVVSIKYKLASNVTVWSSDGSENTAIVAVFHFIIHLQFLYKKKKKEAELLKCNNFS